MRTFYRAALAILLTVASSQMVSAAQLSDDEIRSGAEARIEKHRKADATIVVLDAAGQPVRGAKIAVRQTRHAFLFGANIFNWGQIHDAKLEAAYRERFAALLNYATLGFYWPMYEPQRGQPRHAHAEEVARWCREHGVTTKGHPLAWNFADPPWLPNDAAEVRRLQLARIDDCVQRFAGLIDRWDVVNETAHFEREEFLKKAPRMTQLWQKYGRVEFTGECFEHARQANPAARLVINDYSLDADFARVIERLVDKSGKPLYDVIGMQSHMHGGTWSSRHLWDACERFARFGVPLHFTETTILSGGSAGQTSDRRGPSTAVGEAYQVREVVRFYTLLFSHPAVEAITWWDFADLNAWQGAPAGLVHKDMTPKPAYEELMRLVKGKWWTKADLQSGSDGAVALRGFLGDYQLTVRHGDRPPMEVRVQMEKGKPNRWMVRLP